MGLLLGNFKLKFLLGPLCILLGAWYSILSHLVKEGVS